MKHLAMFLFLFLPALLAACCLTGESAENKEDVSVCAAACDTLPFSYDTVAFDVLKTAYPDFVESISSDSLILSNGEKVVFDDGRQKGFVEMLDDSDVEDMFSIPYSRKLPPEYLCDPGRSRCEKFFRAMYGDSPEKVERNLVSVDWFGKKIRFTSVNGASERLSEVAAELSSHPELLEYLTGASTFYWRKVRGANRLSAHSYGIAIDINVPHSDYWLWSNPKASETAKISYNNRIPLEVVEVFEKHGFIWGGRWYHYDTMHFEYRPDLILYSDRLHLCN